jgi:biopolymer transport protein ExbD
MAPADIVEVFSWLPKRLLDPIPSSSRLWTLISLCEITVGIGDRFYLSLAVVLNIFLLFRKQASVWLKVFVWILFIVALLGAVRVETELRARDSVIWEKSLWQETLSVYLVSGEKYYINGRPVPREALGVILQQELNHRMVWTVYFEADSDAVYMDAIYAMDTIRQRGANLVWITPRVRQELQQRDQPVEAKRE